MTSVELTAAAQRDLVRLQDFLLTKSESAGERAASVIERAILSLREFPERGYIMGGGVRRELPIRFGRDGYVVRYRVSLDRVIVYRIFHARERR